jgi:predicted anti-sigma-YlaC factor YlaD
MHDIRRSRNCAFDDETLERHAMGRLADVVVREHLDSCQSCRARVAERRQWISDLKRVLARHDFKPTGTVRHGISIPMRPEDA